MEEGGAMAGMLEPWDLVLAGVVVVVVVGVEGPPLYCLEA